MDKERLMKILFWIVELYRQYRLRKTPLDSEKQK